jgi:DNA-directed RNA polymerase sigma subunit (sigma70/sigma32)
MREVHTAPDIDAVDAALRQLSPGAEHLLRARFGIGGPAPRRRAVIPRRRLRQVEASAFRTLRLNALGSQTN